MKNFVLRISPEKQSFIFSLLRTISLVIFFTPTILAQGNLLIFPKRLVFDDDKKIQTINLNNIGKDTATYNISFVQIRMNADGSFEQITEPDSNQLFADGYLRYFPRTVRLAPNESQVVKVQLTKTGDLQSGEYRSHLYFRAEPMINPLGEQTPQQTDSTSISVKITPIFGITIPAIIRVGESNTAVSMDHLSLQIIDGSIPVLNMDFHRTGNMSVYGDIIVNYTSPKGKTIKVGEVQGFAVYTPGELRSCHIKLSNSEGVDFNAGEISVEYTSRSENKSLKLAEAELLLN